MKRAINFYLSVFFFVPVLTLISCGQSHPIQLQALAPGPAPETPAEPGKPDVPPVNPNQPLSYQYRVFCASPAGDESLLTMTTSAATSTQTMPQISIADAATPGVWLRNFSAIVPIKTTSGQSTLAFFEASPSASGGETAGRRVYLGQLQLSGQPSTANAVAVEVGIDAQARAAALAMGLELRSFGASVDGRYLIYPTRENKLAIYSASDRKMLATLDWLAGSILNPWIDESGGWLIALEFKNARFTNLVAKLDLSPNSARVATRIAVPDSGSTQTLAQAWPGARLAWMEWSAGQAGSRMDLVVFDLASRQIAERASVVAEAGSKFSPLMAVSEAGGQGPAFWLATERIRKGSGSQPFKVEDARLAAFQIASGQSKQILSLAYPKDVLKEIESDGPKAFGGSFAISSVVTGVDGRGLFITLPRMGVPMVFKVSSDAAVPLIMASGSGACMGPAVLREEY